MLVPLLITATATFSIAVPYVFVQVREATKSRRQGIIEDLRHIFEHDRRESNTIKSFEFVKYKYFLFDDAKQTAHVRRLKARYRRRFKTDPNIGDVRDDFQAFQWLVGSIPLIAALFIASTLGLMILVRAAFKIDVDVGVSWLKTGDLPPTACALLKVAFDPASKCGSGLPSVAWVFLASFTGALLFMTRAFYQAINNFDLTPQSFVGATINLAFGIALAHLFAFGILALPGPDLGVSHVSPPAFPIMIVTAFAAGYFPDVAFRNVLRWTNLQSYKQDDNAIYKAFKAIPVEVIDGIDSDIRARLSDNYINSVQNLAAANPLMLFVETPYGVYQVMDWVAQAQLCASVGPTALLGLWRLGIRTIFDLERILLDRACYEPSLILAVGAVIWDTQAVGPRGPLMPASLAAVKADIRFRLQSPHVQRLRQIFIQVSESLGRESSVLPPLLDCPALGAGRRGGPHRCQCWPCSRWLYARRRRAANPK